jgi:superfamily I DNA and/or RNA helicase
LRRKTEELIADKESQIKRNAQIRDKNAARIKEIDVDLQKTRELMSTVAGTPFGQNFTALALNHFLHSNDSARAIAAYAFYLPDNIPWRNVEVQDFITATKRFLGVCRLVAVTSLSVKNAFPRTDGLFDLLVIDEASQCDVASALPLILRSKQIAIIGDPMQLRHISKIDSDEELAIKRHLGLLGAIHLKYADASLWDYTRNWLPWCGNDAPCVLENHYRCHPEIIGYSNNLFYRTLAFGGLNVCTPQFHGDGQGIVWIDVHGRQTSDTVNRNEAEAQKALEIARQCAQKYPEATIGIVTPFTAQAERINALIPTELRSRAVADTVHKFQGDEKDIMIYSLVVTDNSPNGKIRWIDYKVPNLVNVAVTRAKRLLVIVGNRNYIKTHSRLSLPLGYLEYYVRTMEAMRKSHADNR